MFHSRDIKIFVFLWDLQIQNLWRYHKHCCIMQITLTGIILETEGSVWKIQKRALFPYKKIQKSTPNLTSPYVHSLFTIVSIKQIFEKNKPLRAVSGSQTQF